MEVKLINKECRQCRRHLTFRKLYVNIIKVKNLFECLKAKLKPTVLNGQTFFGIWVILSLNQSVSKRAFPIKIVKNYTRELKLHERHIKSTERHYFEKTTVYRTSIQDSRKPFENIR